MKAVVHDKLGKWIDAYDVALYTQGKEPGIKNPSLKWKRKMLKAEHSPIRAVSFLIEIIDVPNFVLGHLTRHKHGCEWFVKSMRPDITGSDDTVTRDTLNSAMCIINAQGLINISRKRLCRKASKETRQAWSLVVDAIYNHDQAFRGLLVPECIYRGSCHEIKPCGYTETKEFESKRSLYVNYNV